MARITTNLAAASLVCALSLGALAPALADSSSTREFAAQINRPRITVYPRGYLPPNAIRQCRSWLVTEYRASGPVIVPRMRCWWEY
jgi:hypothetical protein